ncbi:MAG: hypothetical protein A4E28_01006 [Methanocella sp. PtaU1.Bin125]|nr:MAG: hypothetical protein A4E28_01006 [Methanocella sp. PtaU1.Bin125]
MADLDGVRTDLERFNEEIEREQYEHLSGQKEDIDTESIYARYSRIFEDEGLIMDVRNRRATARGEERVRMEYLYGFLLGGYAGRKITRVDDRLHMMQAKAEIEVDGKKVSFHSVPAMLANEPDHGKRETIDLAREPVFDGLNPLFRERLDISYAVAEQFGYDDYISMCSDLKGIDYYALREQMQNFLYRTDRLYTRYFRNMCKNVLDLSLSDVRKFDIGYLFRVKEFDRFFAADRMMGVMGGTLEGMGLQLSDQPNIKVDAEIREKKRPRAFCSGIRVPDEVVLCIRPQGGMDDYRALFHEMGHAQHFGNVSPSIPFEYRYLGDVGLSETYAFLFEHLTGNKYWLSQQFEMTDEELFDVGQFGAFKLLFMVRRYAAKLLYELDLHGGEADPEKLYARHLGDALKFRHPESEYLYDLDMGLYCADYLRAWMFETQLRGVLSEEFGSEWWNARGAGEYLRGLWGTGQKFTCDSMARNLGFYGIDEHPLIKEIEKRLRY